MALKKKKKQKREKQKVTQVRIESRLWTVWPANQDQWISADHDRGGSVRAAPVIKNLSGRFLFFFSYLTEGRKKNIFKDWVH